MSLCGVDLVKKCDGRNIVDGVTIEVKPKEIVALLGPNGAGKTTLFDMLVGLIPVTKGEVYVDGVPVASMPADARSKLGIAYLPQEASVFRKLSVEDNIRAVLELRYRDRKSIETELARLIILLDLEKVRTQGAYTLSGGERRRVELARTLAQEPKYILLDEPFTGVDPMLIGQMNELLKQLIKLDIGILISDHNVRDTLSIADKAYIIYDGRIVVSGDCGKILEDEEVKRVYLGKDFSL